MQSMQKINYICMGQTLSLSRASCYIMSSMSVVPLFVT